MNLRPSWKKINLSLAAETKPANRKYSQQHPPVARAFHLVGHTDKTRRENKAGYFMPTQILGIKDNETSFFKLILNPQKEAFKLYQPLTFLSWLLSIWRFLFHPCLSLFFYWLHFLHFLCDQWCFLMLGFRGDFLCSCPQLAACILLQRIISCIPRFPCSLDRL